jgi:3-oxoacyl-[acyl-carrier protein] reductase
MDLNLTNKTALVCGASQGLGLAVAKELALLGANVILVSRNEEKLQQVLTTLSNDKGQQHSYIAIDLSQPELAKTLIEQRLLNEGTIHILVNNAGGPPSGPMIDTDAAEIEKAFRTHVITSH